MATRQMDKYNSLKKINQGSFSLTFLWDFNGKKYRVKCPVKSGHFAYKKWLSHVKTEVLFLKEYAPQRKKIILPKILEISNGFLVQTSVPGIPLTEKVYQTLSEIEQKKIACQLADFFIKLHQQTISQFLIKKKRLFSKKYQKFLDTNEKMILKKYTRLLKNTPRSSSDLCLCIADLKAEHILYNRNDQKIGLVDFGSIHYDFPENEFILKNPIRSHLSLQMLKDMVGSYNTIKKDACISYTRLKCFLVLFAIQEVYGDYNEISSEEKNRLKRILMSFIKKVETTFD